MRRKKSFNYFICVLAICALSVFMSSSCNQGNKTAGNTDSAGLASSGGANSGGASSASDSKKQISPDFNADSAFRYVKEQVAFGPRIPGTKAHTECGAYLVQFFKRNGASVFVQHGQVKVYTGKSFDNQNIIASINPTAKTRVMLTSHWDTRPFSDNDPDPKNKKKEFDSANDGPSGVAVLMEIARNLQKKNPIIGVDIILWDVEDDGEASNDRTWGVGTQYWAAHPPVQNYSPLYCINLDMVGGKNAVFYMEQVSMKFASPVMTKVWDLAHDLGYSSNFSYDKLTSNVDDDHVFVNTDAKIPAIDILDFNDKTGFYKYWHTQNDKVENIDPNVLKAVGQTVMETIYREGRDNAGTTS